MPTVRFVDVSKSYGIYPAVHNLSFGAIDGKITTLLGPSGSGKSTAIRLIAGLEQPDAGEIWLGDRPVFLQSKGELVPTERRGTGMVFQSYALWPHKTVSENIGFPLRLLRLSRAEIDDRIRRVLDLVKLRGYENHFPGMISGGQQQRVALARALVYEPQVLLLDEPLANLDAVNREYLRFEIQDLQKRVGITTIYVTHDQSEAMVLSDYLIIMNKGLIVQAGTPMEVFNRPVDAFVAGFLGVSNLIEATVREPGIAILNDGQQIAWKSIGDETERFASGDKIVLSIRPHQIRVGTLKGDQPNVLQGKVKKRVFAGAVVEYWIETGSLTLRVQRRPEDEGIVGDTTSVWLDPMYVQALRTESPHTDGLHMNQD